MSGELDAFFLGLQERARSKDLSGLDSSYRFEITGGATWIVKISGGEVAVSQSSDLPATCTITASEETLLGLIRGELGATSAYFSGKVGISGDLGAAMQLQRLFG